MISVICCYNDEAQFQDFSASLETQSVNWQLIPIDNREQVFHSAAAALNCGVEQSEGDILVFSHQDIRFLSPASLELLTAPVREAPGRELISGAFGVTRHKGETVAVEDFTAADSVDECLFAMSRRTWERNRFDEKLCDGWHLYAVEFCFRIRQQGGSVTAGDCRVEHLSPGHIDASYMRGFRRLIRKYRSLGYLTTTCKSLPASMLFFQLYYPLWRVKKALLGDYPLMWKLRCLLTPSRQTENGESTV